MSQGCQYLRPVDSDPGQLFCSLLFEVKTSEHPSSHYKFSDIFNSPCPIAQNTKLLCYSQSKITLHRNPLHFVTSIVSTGNREGKFNERPQSALGCDELTLIFAHLIDLH